MSDQMHCDITPHVEFDDTRDTRTDAPSALFEDHWDVRRHDGGGRPVHFCDDPGSWTR